MRVDLRHRLHQCHQQFVVFILFLELFVVLVELREIEYFVLRDHLRERLEESQFHDRESQAKYVVFEPVDVLQTPRLFTLNAFEKFRRHVDFHVRIQSASYFSFPEKASRQL